MSQMGLKPMEDSPISGLGFSIGLRVGYRGESVFNMEFGQEIFEFIVVELLAVIRDDCSWEATSADNRFQDESFRQGFGDLCCRFNPHPLCEIINYDEEKLSLQRCL